MLQKNLSLIALFLPLVIALSACGQTPTPTPVLEPIPSPTPVSVPTVPPPTTRLVGYYLGETVKHNTFLSSVRADQLSHINYAFANVSEQGECVLGDPESDVERVFNADESVSGIADSDDGLRGNFNQILQLKQRHPHLKVLIAVGGWTWSGNFSSAALTEASRQTFAKSCIELFLKRYPGVFDGIDIDWEYPVNGGLYPGRPEDKQNYTLLLAELRRQLDELGAADNTHYLLTTAAPVGPGPMQNIERAQIIQYLDWINLMTYDLHGTWETATNFNAPLYKAATESESALNVNAVVLNYLKVGIPADKLVVGVPFYGRGWQGVPNVGDGLYQKTTQGAAPGTWGEAGAFSYVELKQHYLPAYARFWNVETRVPWLYSAYTGVFISYDDPESLKIKADYVKDKGLGGVMIWQLSQDDGTLLNALYSRLESQPLALEPTPAPYSVIRTDTAGQGTFFDDFNYSGPTDPQLRVNAWNVRTQSAERAAVPDSVWSPDNVAFVTDPADSGNSLLQLSATTDGSAASQAGLSQLNKFYEGTYASRVRLVDAPSGDLVAESLLAFTPLPTEDNPDFDYSALDFTYQPEAGMGFNTWETLDNKRTDTLTGSLAGWHTLVAQVADGKVLYYVDGALKATHGDKYYPDDPMALGYGMWFTELAAATEPRTYQMQVDWLYYAGGETLSPADVETRVTAYRSAATTFEDKVPAWIPVTELGAATVFVHTPGGARPFSKSLKAVSGITIDGKLDEWTGESTFTFDSANQIVYSRAGATWGGAADFSGQAWGGWSEEGLYFAFKITDDKHVQAWPGASLWQGDYLEFQFDTELQKDYDDTTLNEDDYQIGVSAGDFAAVPPEMVVWFGPTTPDALKGIRQAQTQTADGYLLEIFIPKAVLQGITLSEGATFGMNINPSDADDPSQPQKQMMSTSPVRLLSDPTTFGKITLEP